MSVVTENPIARPSLQVVALVLSVALNICVLGGFAYSRWFAPGHPPGAPAHSLEILAARLALKPEQMPAFEEFRKALVHDQQELYGRNHPVLQEAWEELGRDNADPKKVQAALDQMAMHRHAFQADAGAEIIRFMAVLTPEQRAMMEAAVLDRHDPAGTLIRNVGN
jgi:uncharacterized membrane protein